MILLLHHFLEPIILHLKPQNLTTLAFFSAPSLFRCSFEFKPCDYKDITFDFSRFPLLNLKNIASLQKKKQCNNLCTIYVPT